MKSQVQYLFFCLLLLQQSVIWSQDVPGARAAGLSGTALILEDVWAAFHNQAGLAHESGFSAGVFYQDRFMVNQLSDKGFAISKKVGQGAFGLSYKSFGYSAYVRSRAGLAYGMKLGDRFSVGIQLNYHMIRIAEGYGTRRTVTVEAGMLYKVNEHLLLAAHIFNPNNAQLSEYNDEKIPAALRAGAGYRFSQRLLLSGQISKPSDQDPSVSAGLEYQFPEHLILRCGIHTDAPSASFGFGWDFGKWQLDLASAYHQVLGFSPQLSLVYRSHDDQ